MKILGLDISTSCTGFSVIDNTPSGMRLISLSSVKLSNEKSRYNKAILVRTHIEDLHKRYKIDKVFIEENLQAFRPGFSSAKTLLTLARFNGVVSFLCESIVGVSPVFLNVTKARKSVGCQIKRAKVVGVSTKEQVFEFVKNHSEASKYQWPMRTITRGPRAGQVIYADECFDMADAFVISLAGCLYN